MTDQLVLVFTTGSAFLTREMRERVRRLYDFESPYNMFENSLVKYARSIRRTGILSGYNKWIPHTHGCARSNQKTEWERRHTLVVYLRCFQNIIGLITKGKSGNIDYKKHSEDGKHPFEFKTKPTRTFHGALQDWTRRKFKKDCTFIIRYFAAALITTKTDEFPDLHPACSDLIATLLRVTNFQCLQHINEIEKKNNKKTKKDTDKFRQNTKLRIYLMYRCLTMRIEANTRGATAAPKA